MKRDLDLEVCPICENRYAFVRCRITNSKGENMCLNCSVERSKLSTQNNLTPKTSASQ